MTEAELRFILSYIRGRAQDCPHEDWDTKYIRALLLALDDAETRVMQERAGRHSDNRWHFGIARDMREHMFTLAQYGSQVTQALYKARGILTRMDAAHVLDDYDRAILTEVQAALAKADAQLAKHQERQP